MAEEHKLLSAEIIKCKPSSPKNIKNLIHFFEDANILSEQLKKINTNKHNYNHKIQNKNEQIYSVKKFGKLKNLKRSNILESLFVQKGKYPDFTEPENSGKNKSNNCEKIVGELLRTERTYITNLVHANVTYLYHMKAGLDNDVQAIIDDLQILTLHQMDFYSALVLCDSNSENLANRFLEYQYLFEIYVKYISKLYILLDILSTKYKTLVQKLKMESNDLLSLEAHLLTPWQRLTRYILLLKRLHHEQGENSSLALKKSVRYLENITDQLNKTL